MNYKKSLFFVIASLLLLLACEKDDVCLGADTPKMVMRLYDFDTHELKPASDLTVVALPSRDSLYKNISTDSLAVPLDINQDFTEYVLTENNNPDTLHITYTRSLFFVSKACGYIMFFENLGVEVKPDGNLWIKDVEIIENQIKADTSAHVKIYH